MLDAVYGKLGEKERLRLAEALRGQAPTPEAIRAAAELAATVDIDPGGDIHASAEYRRHLAEVLSRRALERAFKPSFLRRIKCFRIMGVSSSEKAVDLLTARKLRYRMISRL